MCPVSPALPMPLRARARLAFVVAVAFLVAGCLAVSPQSRFRASGSQATVFQGYDYGGQTAMAAEGSIAIDVDDETNKGTAAAELRVEGRATRIAFTTFAASRPFHDGGVRDDFPEHGATGNGDALLPELHALSAGWGTGTVTIDGAPFHDPMTGSDLFTLHYMVTDTAVRNPQTGRVTKADGEAAYDPQTPSDAARLPGVMQILLNVQGAPAPRDHASTESDTVTGQDYSRTIPVSVEAAAGTLSVTVSVSNPSLPVPGGDLTFVLRDPTGQDVSRAVLGPAANSPPVTLEAGPPLIIGDYTLEVTGIGVQTSYTAEIVVDYAKTFFLHVVFNEVALG